MVPVILTFHISFKSKKTINKVPSGRISNIHSILKLRIIKLPEMYNKMEQATVLSLSDITKKAISWVSIWITRRNFSPRGNLKTLKIVCLGPPYSFKSSKTKSWLETGNKNSHSWKITSRRPTFRTLKEQISILSTLSSTNQTPPPAQKL